MPQANEVVTAGLSGRIDDIFASAKERGKSVFSFEIFPPRGDMSVQQAADVASQLTDFYPDFVSVTFSAGGSGSHGRAADATAAIAQLLQDQFNVPSIAHLTCVGTTKESISGICEDFRARGIKNVLALRGDLPADGPVATDFTLAVDLIRYLKDEGFCVGAAAYPEGQMDVTDPRKNIDYLKAKQDVGADFFVTQLCFSNSLLYRFLDDAHAAGITAPINCGIMPFLSKSQVQRMIFQCAASLPSPIIKLLAKYEDDEAALRQAGIEYAARQIVDLVAHGVDGTHLYTMNHPDIARTVKDRLDAATLVR